jgi:glycosyltransferase involved in cell wall biosynthesis
MTSVVFIYVLVYSILLISFLLGGYSHLKRKNFVNSKNEKINLENITVIIPFRNEENRISGLLNSIINSQSQPKSYLFIDDHSTDQTQTLIQNHLGKIPFEIVTIPNNKYGKKRAIEIGVSMVNTQYILTLDADVIFENDYFDNLSLLNECDMSILPVKHCYRYFFNGFLQQDVILANLMNVGITGWKRPILCSGANLLFSKDAYLKFTKKSNYFNTDSGDDVFLMRTFQKENLNIHVHYENKLSVKTSMPERITEYFHQRLRWIGKSKKVDDQLANGLAMAQFILSSLNWVVLILSFIYLPLNQIITFLTLKTTIEWASTFSYYRDQNELNLWVFIPIYILILPIINSMIIVSSIFIKPSWKNRLVVQ